LAEEPTAAELLQERLTERGLVRVLAQQDVAPEIVKEVPLEEAAQLIQQSFAPSSAPRPTKKAKKAKAPVKKAKKAKAPKKVKMAKKAKKAKKAKFASKKSSGPTRRVTKGQPRRRYWQRVKRELHILLCTNDKKYSSLRRLFGKESQNTQAFIASSITSGITPYVGGGAPAAMIAPLVTLGLIALLRVGTNAWCAGQTDI
jgi:D-alanyl-D-alanine carboxypeptidase